MLVPHRFPVNPEWNMRLLRRCCGCGHGTFAGRDSGLSGVSVPKREITSGVESEAVPPLSSPINNNGPATTQKLPTTLAKKPISSALPFPLSIKSPRGPCRSGFP